jgi:hypothetical protein
MIYNDEGPELIRGKIYLAGIVLLIGYIIIDALMPNADMIVALRVLQASTAAVVVFVYAPDASAGLNAQAPEKGDFLIVGITIGFFSIMCQALYSIVFRLAGNPWWFANSDLTGLWIMASVVAAFLHLIAPGAVDGIVPRRNRMGLGVAFGFSVMAVLGILWTRPDIGPYLEIIRPYIGDVFRTGDMKPEPPTHG